MLCIKSYTLCKVSRRTVSSKFFLFGKYRKVNKTDLNALIVVLYFAIEIPAIDAELIGKRMILCFCSGRS